MSGWHRLWLLVAVLWLCVVGGAAWLMRPTPENTAHRKEFLAAVSPQSAMVQCGDSLTQELCERKAKVVVAMPNGYHFLLAVDDNTQDGPAAAKSYWRAVERDAEQGQRDAALWAAGVWLVPTIALLGLGHAVAWVRRGFKNVASSHKRT